MVRHLFSLLLLLYFSLTGFGQQSVTGTTFICKVDSIVLSATSSTVYFNVVNRKKAPGNYTIHHSGNVLHHATLQVDTIDFPGQQKQPVVVQALNNNEVGISCGHTGILMKRRSNYRQMLLPDYYLNQKTGRYAFFIFDAISTSTYKKLIKYR